MFMRTLNQHTSLTLTSILFGLTLCQNYRVFPPLSNLARERPVSTSPTESSCGIPTRSSYCRSATSTESVTSCILDYCDQACPLRYALPTHTDLLQARNYDICVSKDTVNRGSNLTQFSALLSDAPSCFLTPDENIEIGPSGEFTISFWARQETANRGTIVEKLSDSNETVFRLELSTETLAINYLSASGAQTIEFGDNYIPPLAWTHIAIQVYERFINLYINGTEVGSSPAVAALLVSRMTDSPGSTRVGQTLDGRGQFVGRIQDLRTYADTLSNREIDEVMTGVIPELHTQTSCRCPSSHPRVKPLLSRYCIRNGMGDTTADQVLRLGVYAHPLEFMNDGDTNSIWVSTQIGEVFLTVDLGDTFQVFYVVMQFYSPLPKGVRIQRQEASDALWEDWQYYADDCQTYFGLENNGPLSTSNSVNCLELSTSGANAVPFSRGNITFSILSQAPIARPGHNDFYNTPELYSFVKASSVRVSMKDHYYVTNPRHQYFGIYEFLVTGRCDCNGHGETCDTTVRPYVCECESESFTQGGQCSSCLPLYNDKPFKVGDQINPYNCKPCNCYEHAVSCVYNSTLDPFPDDNNRGGGGQCVDCQHNTQGVNCELCMDLYYRDLNEELSSPNVCLACDCNTAGTIDGEAQCDPIGGQCTCKENVEGRRCDQCKAGTYNLVYANPAGCSACECDDRGVVDGDMNCDESGRCNCKQYVRGDKCSLCDYGFHNLSINNTDGCLPCDCDPRGSTSLFCDPENGACQCKTNLQGSRCDECVDRFWNIDENCLPCAAHCDPVGTEADSVCDKDSGQCVCKTNVQGYACDECRPSYHSFGSSDSLGCESCGCYTAGTVNASAECQQSDGQCDCKANVRGVTCNECAANTYGLSPSNPDGCSPCDCDPTGTLNGDTLPLDQLPCNQNNGTCTCLSNRIGRRCDSCEATFYLSTDLGGGCLNCNCHARGSVSLTCDVTSGQCQCKLGNAGVAGQRCDQCQTDFYSFNSGTGSCTSCECLAAGSINGTCNPVTGQCDCKQFVAGRQCDECVTGASDLSGDNPFGCSKSPSQQPPPVSTGISSTGIDLQWAGPDYPNGVIIGYFLFRDDVMIEQFGPFSNYTEGDGISMHFNDSGLIPFTNYRYRLQAHNQFGFTESPEVMFRTLPSSPSGDINLTVSDVRMNSASFLWNEVSDDTGVIEKYVLTFVTDHEPNSTVVLYEGMQLSVTIDSLTPYTNYTFTVSACTSGGCSSSLPVSKITLQAPPSGQADPIVTALSADSFYIEWEPPTQPNGVIIYYELWMKGVTQADGSVDPLPSIIFHPSGQYNPRPSTDTENALPPPATNYTITGLIPYTEYEFQVLSQNDVNKAASNWVTARTLESAPLSMPDPIVTPLSDTSLYIQWIEPAKDQINGQITSYTLYMIMDTDLEANPFDPPTYAREIYSNDTVREYTVDNLSPYSTQRFKVGVCNNVACVESSVVSATTLPAAPSAPGHPTVKAVNSTSLTVKWEEPLEFNGPDPYYEVIQSEIAFSAPPPRVIKGTRFPGGGYYLFPPETIPQGVAFTGIDFWFKTTQLNGLLLFIASPGRQDEFVAIQLRFGRPWFLFDPQGCYVELEVDPSVDNNATLNDGMWHNVVVVRTGTQGTITIDGNTTAGCAETVFTTDDEGLPYNDGNWHYLYAHRLGRVGYVELDDVYSGTQSSDCATGTIIGSNTGVYIGGLPKDFVISRTERDPRARIIRHGFQGCIGQVRILQQQTPQEVWRVMDWSTAIAQRDSYPTWHGCPVSLEQPATHFPGRGWLELTSRLLTGNTNSLQFDLSLRTELPNGLLFFAYGGKNVYLYAEVREGSLVFAYRQDELHTVVRLEEEELTLCDGQWKRIAFVKSADQLTIRAENVYQAQNGTTTSARVNLASDFFMGGIPPNTEGLRVADESGLNFPREFGGCIKDFKINRRSIDILGSLVNFTAINLDGCPAVQPPDVENPGCRVSEEIPIYRGPYTNMTYANGLLPFTDYMYKVRAGNEAGSSDTPWVIGTTREAPPYGILAPYQATPLSGYAIDLEWFHPSGNTGLIQSYKLRAYDLQRNNITVTAMFYDSTVLAGSLNNTIPYTNYSVHLEACTLGGCRESTEGLFVQTLEEKPAEVQAPYGITSGPSWIYVGWEEPEYPNGEITGYVLYHEDDELYSGGLNTFNYTELQVFTSYLMKIQACTVVGCTDSQLVSLSTAQLAPEHVDPPELFVYGTRRIDARWTAPLRLNGVLERFSLYFSTSIDDIPGEVVYNSTDVGFLFYRNESLLAGTTYYVTLEACTAGGCTLSDTVNATTVESSPDLVQDPVITALSPYTLLVSWDPPLLPNGIIMKYSLSHNSVPAVFESADVLAYNVTNLLPFSLHFFQLQVCTAKGCTLSNEVSGRTLEAAPEGSITLQVRNPVTEPREITAKWTRVQNPNGIVNYTVLFDGLYYMDAGLEDYSTIRQRRPLLSTPQADEWINIDGLLPYSRYTVQVNATNLAGYIISNLVTVNMPPGAPDGVRPPMLTAINSSAITAIWGPPGRINAPDTPGVTYQLQFRYGSEQIESVYPENTVATSYTKGRLLPFTDYSFRLITYNEFGSTPSEWAAVKTLQHTPASIDPPIAIEVEARSITLTWSAPSVTNGVITSYNIYQNDSRVLVLPGNTTEISILDGIRPYTAYTFTVEACTVAGCVMSAEGEPVQTLQDAPEGLSPPSAVSLTPTSVLLTWDPPSTRNGILVDYTVERWVNNYTSIVLQTLAPSGARSHVDEGGQLSPYTQYSYRISASTAGGTVFSTWMTVRTKSARPSGLQQPVINSVNATAIHLSWDPPQSVNGKLDRYLVKYAAGRQVLVDPNITEVSLYDLTPYSSYNISVTACTDGGCTESPIIPVQTDASRPGGVSPPQPIVLSQTYIAVQWQFPSSPNGPNIRYTLTRMKVRQPLAISPVGLGLWLEAYSGADLYHDDRDLSVYTTYLYRVTVHNDAGFITSDNSTQVVTHGGQPFEAPDLTVTTISHTVLKADWSIPDEVVLQGSVQSFTLQVTSAVSEPVNLSLGPTITSTSIPDLTPNTDYTFLLTVFVNGGMSKSTGPVLGRTADGAPQGVSPPQLFVVSDSAIRVSWTPPLDPNGQITAYNVYIDDLRLDSINTTLPGSYVVENLEPYTVYEFKLEVCTVFACVMSAIIQGTTSEARPQGLSPPELRVLSAREVQISWTEPEYPNGILLRYNVYRRNVTDCSHNPEPEIEPSSRCSYIKCAPLEGLCGDACYTGQKECCGGVAYDPIEGYECCGSQYIAGRNSAEDVCCGGQFHSRQDNHQCCGNRYTEVLDDEICCMDSEYSRVNVGYGDACCNITPYSTAGAQICCAGELHEAYNKQCCGDEVVASDMTCCGRGTEAMSYNTDVDRTCCGSEYVDRDRSICCTDSSNKQKAHMYRSRAELEVSNAQCCELELISNTQSCCNGVGYNSALQVCSDVGENSAGGCGTGQVCPIGSVARCNDCNFDLSHTCHVVSSSTGEGGTSSITPPTSDGETEICKSNPVLIYSGLQLQHRETELMPWSTYEYALTVTNRAGTQSTNYQPIRTAQSIPEGLAPPSITVFDGQLHVVQLDWVPPQYPNGDILQYSLWRGTGGEPAEIYRGSELSYPDDNSIQPFMTYTYTLQACTVVGCVQSSAVEAATKQAPPEQVIAPSAIFTNSTAILLNWSPPLKPNGIIIGYVIYDISRGSSTPLSDDILQLLVNDLEPNTDFSFSLGACTSAACTNSSEVNVSTSQSLPEGLVEPRSVILSKSEVIISWSEPERPYGHITEYRLYTRLGSSDLGEWQLVFSGLELFFQHSNLAPGQTYQYRVEITNDAGTVTTVTHTLTLPSTTPVGIGQPTRVEPLSPFSMIVEWEEPANAGGVIDQYQIIVNGGELDEISISVAAIIRSHTVSNLTPYTRYSVRIGACLQDVINSCAAGPAVYATTHEAAPLDQLAPDLLSLAPDVIYVSWAAPNLPNGLIREYTVYRRLATAGSTAYTVHLGGNDTFSFTNAGPDITAYTTYEYQVVVRNGAGEAASDWSRVTTKEAPPTSLTTPTLTARGAFSIGVQWSAPSNPNGVITDYVIEYQPVSDDPTYTFPIRSITVSSDETSTVFSGLNPNSLHKVRVVARNSAGNVTSEWAELRTGESSPEGIRQLQYETRDTGRSILLRWSPPVRPNGEIIEYRIYENASDVEIYSGVMQEFVYLRLEPYTNYTVRLEACTAAGCSSADWQIVTTAEIQPENQSPPVIGDVNSTSVNLRWSEPLNPYGCITKYEILRLTVGRLSKRTESPVVVFSTNDTDSEQYEYTDTELLPFTSYQYRVRSSNSKGAVESDWVTVETRQAPPSGLLPPVVSFYGSSYDMLAITWSSPRVTNGIIQSYLLQRNDSTPWSFSPDNPMEYIDSELSAYTIYTYTVTACTSTGCTRSPPQTVQTRQSSPLAVTNPIIEAVSSTELFVRWEKPLITNGLLEQYDLRMDSNLVYSGLNTSVTISDLAPYTQYRFLLLACTGGGCTASSSILGRTKSAVPAALSAPILRVVSSTAIEVSWSQPAQPNGLINLYELLRDGELVYSGDSFAYTDSGLLPNTVYSYTVQASNIVGTSVSPVSTAKTYMSSPSGLPPPLLEPLTSTAIRVSWAPPARPNGVITNYTLYDDFSREVLFSGLQFTVTVTGLQFYSQYSIRVQACTVAGCELSPSSSTRTLEAPPTGLDSPMLTPQATASGAHAGIVITWAEPRKPNGVITVYKLDRREVLNNIESGTSFAEAVDVYNGTELRYFDSDPLLRPYSHYEYRVAAYNGAGSASSIWARVLTYQDIPEGIQPLIIKMVSSDEITVEFGEPLQSNGEISSTSVLVNDTEVRAGGYGNQLQIFNLVPYTVYSLVLRVCTSIGCGYSDPVSVTTQSDVPSGMAAPTVVNVTATEVYLMWSPPRQPHGLITGYKVYQRLGCPRAYQPFHTAPCADSEPVMVGETTVPSLTSMYVSALNPYTSYQWSVEAMNNEGMSEDREWSAPTTTTAINAVPTAPVLYEIESDLVLLDWSNSFILNSQLTRYELIIKYLSSNRVSEIKNAGLETRYSLPHNGLLLEITVTAVTSTGTANSSPIRIQGSDNSGSGVIIRTTTAMLNETGITSRVTDNSFIAWLIPVIVISLLLVALAFFLLVKCARGKSHPYQREKSPLPKRQYRQGTLTPIQSFHDVLGSQAAGAVTSQTHLTSNPQAVHRISSTPQPNSQHSQLSNPSQSSHPLHTTPQGLSYSRLSSDMIDASMPHLPYTSYTNTSYSPGPPSSQPAQTTAVPPYSADMQRGAMIWPVNGSVTTPQPPQHQISDQESVSEDSRIAQQDIKQTNLDDEKMLSDDDDMWDSVLQESGMYDDSDFSETSSAEFPHHPSTFTDTHL